MDMVRTDMATKNMDITDIASIDMAGADIYRRYMDRTDLAKRIWR